MVISHDADTAAHIHGCQKKDNPSKPLLSFLSSPKKVHFFERYREFYVDGFVKRVSEALKENEASCLAG